MTYIPSKLRDLVEQAKGKPVEIASVELLLSWYKAQRRSPHVLQQIKAAFAELRVQSEPDFEGAFLEAPLTLVPISGDPSNDPQHATNSVSAESEVPVRSEAYADPTYRVGRLEAANRVPIMVRPDAMLSEVVTLMLRHDVSQVPVASSDRTVLGLVSWKSIGCALALGTPCSTVRECMIRHSEIRSDVSLFSAIGSILEFGHAIVKDAKGKVCGIVTSADLSFQFGRLSEPFLLIGEVENHLRRLIDSRCDAETVKSAKNPKDLHREILSAADLSFGEYVRLFEHRDTWNMFGLKIDRKMFVGMLNDVRRIRNDVMHFDPDGIEPKDEKALRDLVHLLQTLAYYRVI